METVEKVLRLYREVYNDFNVSHFVDKLHEEHEIDLSYSWVKKALQEAGLVAQESTATVMAALKETVRKAGDLLCAVCGSGLSYRVYGEGW